MHRASLVIGGSGALGKAVVNDLVKAGYKAISLDLVQNPVATSNIIVDSKKPGFKKTFA
jgi:nucleoside-diphosphate-sugar epimerase